MGCWTATEGLRASNGVDRMPRHRRRPVVTARPCQIDLMGCSLGSLCQAGGSRWEEQGGVTAGLCSARTRLNGAGLTVALALIAGAAAPSMAQERRACAGDTSSLCLNVLPDVGRIKSCVRNKDVTAQKGTLLSGGIRPARC